MLDHFKISQNIQYDILKKTVEKDKVSHAYLFVTNGYPKAMDFALSFAKYLFCPFKKTSNIDCNGCHQCKTIDDKNYTELKIIEPDGMVIKKEQLLELQEEFNKKALTGSRKVYIINHAECLNPVAANSILKFLEEPVPNITAILIVDNIYRLLDTIISRCQIINLNKEKIDINDKKIEEKIAYLFSSTEEELANYSKEEYKIKIESIIKFINEYEKKGKDILLDTNHLFHEIFKEKNDIIYALTTMILFYKDVLNYKLNMNLVLFKNYENDISNISNKNSIKEITNKINVVMQAKENIGYNANTNLLIDKLIIDLEG